MARLCKEHQITARLDYLQHCVGAAFLRVRSAKDPCAARVRQVVEGGAFYHRLAAIRRV
ncbi:MAG TPA: hypothetical protein VFB12_08955 [Ktedonobacteraceae bacterium]|nr:hypothetical protein [Ktedonobacteraceae bacterium]